MADSEEHGAEEREELAPRAEAPRHRIGETSALLLQPCEQREHAQLLLVERVANRHELAVFAVEEEHEPEENREESAVEVVALPLERVLEKSVAVALRGGFESCEQDLERLEDLLRELVGDSRLAPSAVLEQRWQAVFGPIAKKPERRQEHDESVEDRSAADRGHVRDPERDRAARLPVGSVDEPELVSVREEPDR